MYIATGHVGCSSEVTRDTPCISQGQNECRKIKSITTKPTKSIQGEYKYLVRVTFSPDSTIFVKACTISDVDLSADTSKNIIRVGATDEITISGQGKDHPSPPVQIRAIIQPSLKMGGNKTSKGIKGITVTIRTTT